VALATWEWAGAGITGAGMAVVTVGVHLAGTTLVASAEAGVMVSVVSTLVGAGVIHTLVELLVAGITLAGEATVGIEVVSETGSIMVSIKDIGQDVIIETLIMVHADHGMHDQTAIVV
jgi:hypothetical protein